MNAHDYHVERLLLLDLYWEGTITFLQYVKELQLIQLKRQFTLAGIV